MQRICYCFLLSLTIGIWYTPAYSTTTPIFDKIFTQEKQQKITPKQALIRLKEGNKRFLENKTLVRDYLKQAKQSSYGQYPFAVVLNCMDSRSIPELFFDQGLADLFSLRVAGNVLNDDIIGSMEFATQLAGAKLIVVLGHTSCGAVAGACNDVKLGYLTEVIRKIQPVVKPTMTKLGMHNCAEAALIDEIAKANALQVVRDIQQQSPILRELVASKKIGIIAGLHHIQSGQVEFFDEERSVPNS